MRKKAYALFEQGGRTVRGISYGKLVEVKYLDVERVGIESPDREEFIRLVNEARFSDDELDEFRIGYVDENGVGKYYGWREFLEQSPEPAQPAWPD